MMTLGPYEAKQYFMIIYHHVFELEETLFLQKSELLRKRQSHSITDTFVIRATWQAMIVKLPSTVVALYMVLHCV